jgi:hypothetical protein
MKRVKLDRITSDMESVALGTLLAGMRKLYFDTERFMRSTIEEIEQRYGALNNTPFLAIGQLASESRKKRGRPPGNGSKRIAAGKNGWAGMSREERSAEMRRRQAVSRGDAPSINQRPHKRAATESRLHPRDAAHPKHAQWLKKMRRGSKKRWDGLTEAERKATVNKMVAAKREGLVNGQAHA